MVQFAKKLVELRENRSLTQLKLSRQTGINRASISHYEKGRREPDFETLDKLANFFGVSLDYLIRGVD